LTEGETGRGSQADEKSLHGCAQTSSGSWETFHDQPWVARRLEAQVKSIKDTPDTENPDIINAA
jgi:hypothetical protein